MIDYAKQKYQTIFGFDTSNKVSAKAIDIVYWIIIGVAYCFAFHALNLILVTWNWFLVGLASLGVVGLPYCVKIILFGREKFPRKAALLCVFLSLLPTIFDFSGFYAETGLQDSVKLSKVKISEQINLFEIESKKLASDAELTIKDEERQKLTGLEEKLSRKNTENLRNINEANQKVIDEKTGVRADYSTGKVGDGPRAKELQAEVRRLQSQAELDAKVAMEQIERESSLIKEQAKDELKKLQVANKMVDERFIIIKKTVNSAKNFKELENALIEVNGTLSTIAAKLKVEYKPVEIVGSDNIIKLSFSALTNFEITAWVCLLLAILMEIGDIVIVYVIRYQKEEHEKPLLKLAKSENDVQKYIYKKTYSGY
ncbi:MAG: hypothetical protein EBU90_19610 [Proteobacteria bacterium]|nr:hypothetical protein [Pseudomonadota bacterium]